MRKIFLAFAVLYCTSTLQAQIMQQRCSPNSSTYSIPSTSSIPSIIKDAGCMKKIGTLPNGDMLYFLTELKKEIDTSWVALSNDMSVSEGGYCTHECLLIYSKHFERWDLLTFNPSITMAKESFCMTEARLLPSWDISVTFKSKNRKINATWSLKFERFLFKNLSEQELVEGIIPHTILY